MAGRRRITKQQAAKVAKMRKYLRTGGLRKPKTIMIETEVTHIAGIKDLFQNVTGLYIMGGGSAGDRLTFAGIHRIYTAALKDKGFNAYVAGGKGPVKDKGRE